MEIAFIGAAVLFFLGHGLEWVFSRTKFPDVLVLIGLGYLAGPVLGIVTVQDFGKLGPFLTTLALVVILYEGGVRLQATSLLRSSLPAAGLSLLGAFSVGVLALLLTLIFQPWPVALLVGLGIGSTSSAVVIPMVRFLNISERTRTILSLESAFTDILVIVTFLVAAEAIASGTFNTVDVMVGLGPKTVQAVLMGMGAGLFWAFLRRRFRPLTEYHFSGEAFACLVFGLLDYAGFNGAMGVLALGFTLSNLNLLPDWAKPVFSKKPVTRDELELLGAVTFLLKTYFFIFLGMMIQSASWSVLVLAGLITVAIFVTRYLAVRLLFSRGEYSRVDAMTATAMGPRGLAVAVLASVPVQMGISGGEWVQSTLVSVIPMSIIVTSLLVMLSSRPGFRLRMLGLFGSYREDFGLAELGLGKKEEDAAPPTVPAAESPSLSRLGLVTSSAYDDDDLNRPEPTIPADLPAPSENES